MEIPDPLVKATFPYQITLEDIDTLGFGPNWCSTYSLASAASYLNGGTPAENAYKIRQVYSENPIEETPLMPFAIEGKLDPIIDVTKGTEGLERWMQSPYAQKTLEFVNKTLRESLGLEISSLNSQGSDEEFMERIKEILLSGFPIMAKLFVLDLNDNSDVIGGHSFLMSPKSTASELIIHDNNCSEPNVISWTTVLKYLKREKTIEVFSEGRGVIMRMAFKRYANWWIIKSSK